MTMTETFHTGDTLPTTATPRVAGLAPPSPCVANGFYSRSHHGACGVLIASLAVLLVVVLRGSSLAVPGPALVISHELLDVSGETYVTVSISGTVALNCLQIGPENVIRFDPDVIEVEAVEGCNGFVVLASSVDNERGEIRAAATCPGGSVAEGPAMRILVRAIGVPGQESAVTLTGLDVAYDAESRQVAGVIVASGGVHLREHVLASSLACGPNPISAEGAVFFYTLAQASDEAVLKIYALTGRLVFEVELDASGSRFPAYGRWSPVGQDGEPLVDGPYLAVLIVGGVPCCQTKVIVAR